MGGNTITEDELMEKARELGTVEAANKWMRQNNLKLVAAPLSAAGGRQAAELPPVAQGGLSAVAAEDVEAGTSDFGSIDFAQAKRDPGAFYSNLMRMSQEADVRAAQASKQLYEEGRKRILEKYAGPSRSEELFALSRAILAPRKTRGFGSFIGSVAGALGESEKAAREAEQTREQKLFELQQQYQQGEIERAAARPKTAADLAKAYAEAAKVPVARAVGTQIVGGKVVAVMQDPTSGAVTTTVVGDAPQGLKAVTGVTSGGQPVFTNAAGKTVFADGTPVTEFDVKAKPVSATEQREIFETEDAVNSGLGTVRSLEDALKLNQQAYEGTLSGWRKTLGQLFSSDDPQYVATEAFDNTVASGALRDLKAMFGANPTEGERKIYMDLQAVSTKTRAVREEILRRALDAVKRRISRETGRLERLKSGEYSTRGGSTVGESRTIRYDRKGNRI